MREVEKHEQVIVRFSIPTRRAPKDGEEESKKEKEEVDEEMEGESMGEISQPMGIVKPMYAHQVEGLNWLIQLFELNEAKFHINGILADEMGLGKTLQTIAMLSYLRDYRPMEDGKARKHIIIVPLSTIDNWVREFKIFCPSMGDKILRFYGTKEEKVKFLFAGLRDLETI